ncbi:MAG: ArsR family transcriptional regulator [Leptospiraceae bacterium]|nr:ArsR family transcriptional regulator [Leptospiraceae bacterium]
MLELILGNKTAERVLLHIYHYGEIHASAISSDYKIALTPILNQLNRFEMAGILISKEIGKARLYSFNPKSAFTKPMMNIIKIAYDNIPLENKEKIFKIRRRPRRKGKPVK